MGNNKKLSKPRFSIIMFLVALTADSFVAGIVFLMTLILPPAGWALGIFVNIVIGGIFWLWLFFKSNLKKLLRGSMGILSAVGVGALPFFRLIIFEWVAFVLFQYISEWTTYLKEKKKQEKHALP